MRPWIVVDSRYVLKRPWLKLREDHVHLPQGGEIEAFHVVELPDWTCVLCFTEKAQVVMVEQYRHGAGRTSLELPAGVIDVGETALMAARRELREETGYIADEWTPIGTCAPDPTKQNNYAHFFVARGARRIHEQCLDAGESITIRLMDAGEVLRMADRGEVLHGIHVAAIFWARHRGLWPVDE